MKLHFLQHVPFEGIGFIEEWTSFRKIETKGTRLFAKESLPAMDQFDWLVVMGGPMGIYDHDEHPWLVEEKAFIKQAIDAGKTIVGICLGAQLIADVLGAKVYPGPHKEIGWYPIHRFPEAPKWFPEKITVFHWHGDTFDLPAGAIQLAHSDACHNQGFLYRDRVLALQFHMESTHQSVEALVENCAAELVYGPYIQSAMQIRSSFDNISHINVALSEILDELPQP